MKSLAETQRAFQHYLLSGDNTIESSIVNLYERYAQNRMAVYGNMYSIRLQEVIREEFPLLAFVLGDEKFTALVATYIREYPSKHYSIRYFADQFITHIKNFNPGAGDLHREIAEFEWQSVNVLDESDAPVLTFVDLQSVPQENWPNLQIDFHPTVRPLWLHWNIADLWIAFDDGASLPEAEYSKEPTLNIVWRKVITPFCDIYHGIEAKTFLAASDKMNFSEICEMLCQEMPEEEVPGFAVNQLAKWFNQGIVTNLSY